ncbi:zinc finger protein 431 [Drosophila biarmipes]|uniref:zinc finger protein 431 n=1 Tax=Drosophila biarmipes TaxID=125945 RepID=UPI0007E7440E|nr:zinc finger protein 431 [Drosophila biarmipes]
METCGLICVSGDYEKFLMRCSHCPTDVEVAQWQEFVLHIRNMHSNVRPVEDEISKSERAEAEEGDVEFVKLKPAEEPLTEEDDEMNDQEKESEDEEDVNEAVEGEEVGSSMDATEESNPSEATDYEESDEEEEPRKCPYKKENGPVYKFNPSFFRLDPRTQKFIEIYKGHPCLWDTAHSEYKEPRKCKEALKQIIADLESTVAIFFNEISLKMAIKKIHVQFQTVHKRVLSGKQKPHSLPFKIYTLCSFLKDSMEEEAEANRTEKIKLDFSEKNKLTTDLIEKYANFPQLYDSTHKDFSNMSSRKQAYESMASEISVPNEDINSDDILRAIQTLRQWYYRTTKHPINAGGGAETFYLEMCRFMPPKMFKQRLVCEHCNQATSSDYVLQAHIFKEHNIGELPFKCSLCDRSFAGRAELTTHVQRVHIGKTRQCTYCEMTFSVISDLRLHIRTHTGHKPYICEHCGKAFRLRSQMTLHVTAIHKKLRAFKCTMCPKDFVKKVHLTDHIKGHLNIRDKICSMCGKGFTSCHSLIRHRQIHSEVKKFVCKVCDARFSQFVGLNSHMKRTHNIVRNNAQKAKEEGESDH